MNRNSIRTGIFYDIILVSMRKVVERINRGQLYRNQGALTFSTDTVEISVHTGEICEGSFSVFSSTHSLVEGTVCTDDYRMDVINPSFSGMQDEIAYKFHADELPSGQDIRGNFVILSNRGEFLLPFVVHVEENVLESSLGPVRNLFHFTNVAKANWKEAIRLFYDPDFVNIFTGGDRDFLPIYKCLSGVPGSVCNMDEFLISIRKKTPIEYIPSETSIEINDPVGISRYSFNISRNGWGYTELSIETEGDFIEIDKSQITFDDFLGNNYLSYYYIDADKLHAGKNFGAIIIRDPRNTTRIPVIVHSDHENSRFREMLKQRAKGTVQLMEYYQAFRFKKISTRTWLDESNKVVTSLLQSDSEDLSARLYQTHIMLTQEQYNEANWNLKSVKAQAESVKETAPHLWCYFLYLCSLSDYYDSDYDAIVREVEYSYAQNPNQWRIAWLLSYLSDEYKSITRKWVMYEKTYEMGCNSPVVYLEASRLVIDNPEILTKLDGFELQVIRYLCKMGMLSDEIVFCIRTIAEREKEYSKKIVSLLMECYKDYPHDELLLVICSQLMKGNRTDKEAFKWYGYAVKQELKITRLYEYYMMSVDRSVVIDIPRTVLMYFSFHSDLSYEMNAYLYSIVLDNKDKDPDMYSRYLVHIQEFVREQLIAGHNNRYLCKIYKSLIDDELLNDEVMARRVADVIFFSEIDATMFPTAKRVVVCYGHHDGEEIYPLERGVAEIPIYSTNYCIALEDEYNNRYVLSKQARVTELMPTGRILLNLQIILKDHIGLDVHCCMEHQMTFDVRMENEFRFRNLLEKNYFSKEYSRSITMKLVRFYYDQDRIEELDRFLDTLDADSVSPYERAECIRYLAKRHQYGKAMNWIYRFGPEGIDRVILFDIVSGWLPMHAVEPEAYYRLASELILLTIDTARNDKNCMQYMIEYANGPLRVLRDVWIAVKNAGMDSRQLEERILIQLMYTGAYIKERGDILKSYAYNVPDGDILSAVLANASYEFFVSDDVVSGSMFEVLTEAFESDIELQIICSLAYVKYYAENKHLIDDKVKPLLKDVLHRLLSENKVLACYQDLADLMPSMANYADATIIEYKTKPGTEVTIHYVIESDAEGEYISEKMDEVYGGVYTRMYTLFFGEKLMYYITEESEDAADALSESKTITRNDIDNSAAPGRFGIINDICIAKTLHDYATVDAMLLEYYRTDYMTGKLFGMHKGTNADYT